MKRKFWAALLAVCLMTTLACPAGVFARDVNVTFVTPKGLYVRAAEAGTNMTYMGPTDLNVDGFAFCGWNVSLVNVQQDTIATAVYRKMGFTSETSEICNTWQNLPSGVLSYTHVTSATIPKESVDFQTPRTWMETPCTLTALQTIQLNPAGVPGKTCVVKWYNGSTGELWKADVVPYGATLPQPENPCITGLEFTGWNGSWTNITEDRNIVAGFYKNYKVVYMCEVCKQPIGDTLIRVGDAVPPCKYTPHNHDAEGHGYHEWLDPMPQGDGYTIVVLADYNHIDRREDFGYEPEEKKKKKKD